MEIETSHGIGHRSSSWVGPRRTISSRHPDQLEGHSGRYTISINRVPDRPLDDHADRYQEATEVELGSRIEGKIHDVWDMDFFQFTADVRLHSRDRDGCRLGLGRYVAK